MNPIKYNLYLTHGDILIGKYKVLTTDLKKIYNEMGAHVVIQGFKSGNNIEAQIKKYKYFIDYIHTQKINCYKIKASDLIMYLTCYLCLDKFNVDVEEPIFLKIKKKKKRQPICLEQF